MNESIGFLSPSRRRAAWILAGAAVLVAAQGGLRVWLAGHAGTISDDGSNYVRVAREMSVDWRETLRQYPYHPAYPASMIGADRLLRDADMSPTRENWERAGVAVSLAASVLALLGVWAAAAWMFGNVRLGWIAAMLLGFGRKYAAVGADVLTDSLMLCLQLGSLLAAIVVIRRMDAERSDRGAVVLALLGGLLAGGAYLVRPEGIVVLPVFWIVWGAEFVRNRARRRLLLICAIAAGVAALAAMTPYMWTIGGLTNKWGPLAKIETWGAANPPLASCSAGLLAVKYSDSPPLLRFVGQFFEAQHPILATLTCLWLAGWLVLRFPHLAAVRLLLPTPCRRAGVMLAGLFLLVGPFVILWEVKTDAMSYRYLLLPAALTAGLAAAGLEGLVRLVRVGLARRGVRLRETDYFLPVAVGAVLFALLSHCLTPPHEGKAYLKRAGLALHEAMAPDEALLCDQALVLYYSEAGDERQSPPDFKKRPEWLRKVLAGNARSFVWLALSGKTGEDDQPDKDKPPVSARETEILREAGLVLWRQFHQNKPDGNVIRVYRRARLGGEKSESQ